MKFKTLSIVTALFSSMNGLAYLFAPVLSLELMAGATNAIGLFNTRVAGAFALGIMVINWQARNTTDRHIQRIIVAGNTLMFIALIPTDIHAVWTGTLNWIGWLFLIADSVLGIQYTRMYLKLRD